ncbi:MAG: T9SS C-terminal target domain-containing protein [Bacteroidetes bacterium]|nr:MAG: T9SS C-terminal target domain-containing protein [Bacteroidota bacterium]
MKHLLSLLFSLLLLTSLAGNIELEKAMLAGKNFFYEQINHNGIYPYEAIQVRGTYTETLESNAVYYALNFSDGGWVLVAAEDAVTPILAYSFEGRYERGDHPPQFAAWMEGYARQIAYSRTNNLEATEEVRAAWDRLSATDPATLNLNTDGRDVAPLLTSTWNQGNPYNFLCPADPSGPGGHVYAGCVATAMAQVVYYYRWPETGVGQHCYNPSGYPQQCADFANTTYFWNEMVNSTGTKDTAMGLIQWHCGIAVNMMYGAGGSGAYSEDAAAALRNYFKYGPNTVLLYKENYTEEQWAAILKENLDAGRPMYYHGFGSGGHAFNVDGYQGTNYFHFNWGWGGSYNGYYYLNNLNPGGSNFTEGQGAIVNIYPDTLNYTYPAYCSGQTTLTALKGTFEDGSCPLNYQDNASCSWLIHPQSSTDSIISITISFQRFSTEQNTDLVSIYQGSSNSGTMIAQYSGNDLPPAVTIDGNIALITFTSNNTTRLPGWFASYQSESMDWCSGITTLTDPEGTISDGSFDYDYKNSTLCRWKIVPEGMGPLELSFTFFQTESSNDVLRIYDFGTETLLASYSGIYNGSDVPAPVLAPSGQMFLIFSTNNNKTEAGWEAEYITYPVGQEESPLPMKVNIFPNPADNIVYIQIPGKGPQSFSVDLFTLQGRKILSAKFASDQGGTAHGLPVSELVPGMYLIRITSDSGTVGMEKIVVNP